MVSEYIVSSARSILEQVLILVVMEDGLGVTRSQQLKSLAAVLILVVMEDGLGDLLPML